MISVKDLTIWDDDGRAVVDRVSFDVVPGLDVALVGQSGSGKSTTALAMLGLIRAGLRRREGEVLVDGEDLLRASPKRLRAVRRTRFAYLGQDPSSSLTPTMRIGALLRELADDAKPDDVLVSRLAAFGLPADPALLRRYPHELSGGQRQRLALARALTNDPDVLILDEPTTGLDPITQKLVLDEVEAVAARSSLTMVVISHDLSVVARFADDVLVMRDGQVVDRGSASDLLARPTHDYTRHLVSVTPHLRPRPPAEPCPEATSPMLAIRDVHASHHSTRSARAGNPVLTGIDLEAARGECLAVVGPSGSGKTTLARCIVGLHRPGQGDILLAGEPLASVARHRTTEHRRRVQLVPQDPGGSLNPRRRVDDILARPLHRLLQVRDKAARRDEVRRLLELVHLDGRVLSRRARDLSGGERQRVALARALAARPDVLVCDEMTSALDVSVQHEILGLVDELRRELSLTTVFITHDLGVVAEVADRVAVLEQGTVCEQGAVASVLHAPSHRLTASLVASVSTLETELAAREIRTNQLTEG